jgi:hypothetical protein
MVPSDASFILAMAYRAMLLVLIAGGRIHHNPRISRVKPQPRRMLQSYATSVALIR